MVGSFSDLYRLHDRKQDLLALERLGEKSVDNLLEGIETSKSRPVWRLLTALNIRHVGVSTARVLADYYGSIDAIAEQPVQSLAEVQDVGPIVAQAIHDFFQSDYGRRIIQELRDAGLNFGVPVPPQDRTPEEERR